MQISNSSPLNIVNLIRSKDNQNMKDDTIKKMSLKESNEQYDRLEISEEGLEISKGLCKAKEITITKPSEWTIMSRTFESKIENTRESLEKRDNLNLSYAEGLQFMKDESSKWVEKIRENDPEMFVAWLKLSKDDIVAGRPDFASLPSNFTIEDYYSYVGNEE